MKYYQEHKWMHSKLAKVFNMFLKTRITVLQARCDKGSGD